MGRISIPLTTISLIQMERKNRRPGAPAPPTIGGDLDLVIGAGLQLHGCAPSKGLPRGQRHGDRLAPVAARQESGKAQIHRRAALPWPGPSASGGQCAQVRLCSMNPPFGVPGHSGATTTPQGCWPTWTDWITSIASTSMIDTSFELPLVVIRNFSSGVKASLPDPLAHEEILEHLPGFAIDDRDPVRGTQRHEDPAAIPASRSRPRAAGARAGCPVPRR